jgi:ketosteroid isomerase-like protein
MQSTTERQGVIPPKTRETAPAPSRANPWLIGAVVALSIALIAAVTWAFAERSANDTAAPVVASDAVVVQAVNDSIDAWTNGDADAIHQVYAPDAVFVDMIADTTHVGADEIADAAVSATGDEPGWLKLTSLVMVHDGTAAYGFQVFGPNNQGVALVEVNSDGQITYQVVRPLVSKPVPANA